MNESPVYLLCQILVVLRLTVFSVLFHSILGTPCGQLPVLSYNGVEIGQSMTICRYLANEFGLAGKTNLERARSDMIVDCVSDIYNKFVTAVTAPEDKKAELEAIFDNETVPSGLDLFEKLLKQNEGEFFVGDSVSYILLC